MISYIYAMIFSIIIAFFIKKKYGFSRKKTLKMFISILPLTLLSGFRYDVGYDTLNIYRKGFYLVGEYGLNWFSEPGFILIIKFFYFFTHKYYFLIFAMSILNSFLFSKCFKVYGLEKYVILYIVLYVFTRYYFCSLNIVRQSISMLLVLYSLHYLQNKQYKNYIILILISSLFFHKTSIVFLPLGFVLNLDPKYTKNIILLFSIIPLLLFLTFYFVISNKYIGYFNTMRGNDGSMVYTELLICISVLISIFASYKNLKNNNYKMFRIFLNMQYLTFGACLLSPFLPIADRIIWLFSIQNLFFIPIIIDSFQKYTNKIIFSNIMILCLFIVFIAETVFDDSYFVIPYNSIFNESFKINYIVHM